MDDALTAALVAARDAIDAALAELAARAGAGCPHLNARDVTAMGEPRTWLCRACGAVIVETAIGQEGRP